MTSQKKQVQLNGNQLLLTVKKAPVFVRLTLFIFAFLAFLMPLLGMVFYISDGNGFHIGFLFGFFFFGVIGFYLLRIALWNTYGKEVVTFHRSELTYLANYGWFSGSEKRIERDNVITFSTRKIGYEDQNKGGLVVEISGTTIQCVTKMPIVQLEDLVNELSELIKHN